MMLDMLVGGIIVHRGRVLLGRRAVTRSFYPNVWDIFGGHLEPGEEPEQALVRELEEELGIVPASWSPLATHRVPVTDQSGITQASLTLFLYCVTAWSGTPCNRQPHEHSAIGWFTLTQVAELELAAPAFLPILAVCLAYVPKGGQPGARADDR
jgi:8-oxo-dGTP diphosphatase